jgi:hypothetical protein
VDYQSGWYGIACLVHEWWRRDLCTVRSRESGDGAFLQCVRRPVRAPLHGLRRGEPARFALDVGDTDRALARFAELCAS